jgi:hypothetical protein
MSLVAFDLTVPISATFVSLAAHRISVSVSMFVAEEARRPEAQRFRFEQH